MRYSVCYVTIYDRHNIEIPKYIQQLSSVILLNIFVISKAYHLQKSYQGWMSISIQRTSTQSNIYAWAFFAKIKTAFSR